MSSEYIQRSITQKQLLKLMTRFVDEKLQKTFGKNEGGNKDWVLEMKEPNYNKF